MSNDQLNPRFLRNLKNYLNFWLAETAVINDDTIKALNAEYPNLISLLETAVLLPQTRNKATQLVLQCFFWIENAGHVTQWRPLVEQFVKHLPATETELQFRLQKQLGQLYRLEKNFKQAIMQFDKAQAISQLHHDKYGEADCLLNLGQTFYEQKQYEKATNYGQRALMLIEDSTSHLQSLIYQHLGNVAYECGAFETAVSHYQTALNFKHPGETTANRTRTMNRLALAHRELNQFSKSFALFEEIDQLLADTPYLRDRLDLKIGWGALHYSLKEWSHAKRLFQDALELLEGQVGYLLHKGTLYNNLACVLRNQEEWSKAVLHFEHSIQIFIDLNDNLQLANCFSGLAKLYELQEKFAEAIEALETAVENIDNLPKTKRTEQTRSGYVKRISQLKSPDKATSFL